MGRGWQKVFDFTIVRESPESYIPQFRKVSKSLDPHIQLGPQKAVLQRRTKKIQNKYGDHYSEIMTSEKNRERYEWREYQSYSDKDGIKAIQEERPNDACVERLKPVRNVTIGE